jgi:hypothetical protein
MKFSVSLKSKKKTRLALSTVEYPAIRLVPSRVLRVEQTFDFTFFVSFNFESASIGSGKKIESR